MSSTLPPGMLGPSIFEQSQKTDLPAVTKEGQVTPASVPGTQAPDGLKSLERVFGLKIPLVRNVRTGHMNINRTKLEGHLASRYSRRGLAELGKSPFEISAQELADIRSAAKEKARVEVETHVAKGHGLPWIEVDPEGTTKAMMDMPSSYRALRATLEPAPQLVEHEGKKAKVSMSLLDTFFRASLDTPIAAGIKFQEGIELTPEAIGKHQSTQRQGMITWLGGLLGFDADSAAKVIDAPLQAADAVTGFIPLTLGAPVAQKVAEVVAGMPKFPWPHSQEAIEWLREGHDILDVWRDIGKNVHEATGLNETASGVITTGLVMLLSPGVPDLALGAAGSGVKATARAINLRQLEKHRDGLAATAEAFINNPKMTINQAEEMAVKLTGTPTARKLINVYMRGAMKNNGELSKALERLAKGKSAPITATHRSTTLEAQRLALQHNQVVVGRALAGTLPRKGFEAAVKAVKAKNWAVEIPRLKAAMAKAGGKTLQELKNDLATAIDLRDLEQMVDGHKALDDAFEVRRADFEKTLQSIADPEQYMKDYVKEIDGWAIPEAGRLYSEGMRVKLPEIINRISGSFDELIKVATTAPKHTSSVITNMLAKDELDLAEFARTVSNKYGSDLESFLARGSASANMLAPFLGRIGTVRLTPKQRLSLLKAVDSVGAFAEDESTFLARTIMEALRKDPNIIPGNMVGRLRQGVVRLAAALDPMRARFGEYAPRVADIIKRTERTRDKAYNEILNLINNPMDIYRYLDATDTFHTPRKGIAGKDLTVANMGEGSLFIRAKAHILNGMYESSALDALSRIFVKTPGIKTMGADLLFDETIQAMLKSATRKALAESNQFMEFATNLHKALTNPHTPLGKALSDAVVTTMSPGKGLVIPGQELAYAAMSIAHAGIIRSGMKQLTQAVGGQMTQMEARAVTNVLGNPRALKTAEETDAALKNLLRWGMPFTQGSARTLEGNIGAVSTSLKTFTDIGDGLFVPQNVIDELEGSIGAIIKQWDTFHQGIRDPMAAVPFLSPRNFTALWKRSVTTGLILPKPKYWFNNFFGAVSQIWLNEGAWTAGKVSFQTLPAWVPYGKKLIEYTSKLGEGSLGTMFNAIFNPALGKVLGGRQDDIVRLGRYGDLEVGAVQKWIVEDGIDQSFINAEVVGRYKEVAKRVYAKMGFSHRAEAWQDNLMEFAQVGEARQRVGLYMELLRIGYSREEAKRRTLDALYDWSSDFAQWELQTLAKHVPFYRFFKLATKQTLGAFLDPLVKPGGYIGDSLLMKTKFQHLTQMGRLAQAVPDWAMGSDWDESDEDLANYHAWLHPEWMKNQIFWTRAMTDGEKAQLEATQNRQASHIAYVLPPTTSLDVAAIPMGILSAMAGAFAGMTGDREASADLFERGIEPILKLAGPVNREALEAMTKAVTDKKVFFSDVPVNPGQEKVLQALGGGTDMFVYANKDKDGRSYTSWAIAMLLSNLPLIGTQLPDLYNVYGKSKHLNVAEGTDRDWVLGIGEGLGHLTGLPRQYPFDPSTQVEWWEKDVSEGITTRKRDIEKGKR